MVGLVLSALIMAVLLAWAVADHAGGHGFARALRTAVELDKKAGVTVYSTRPLHLDVPGVQAADLGDEPGGFRYRYTGLRLPDWSNDRYFLLPSTWSATNPVTIVLPDDPSLRVELARGAD